MFLRVVVIMVLFVVVLVISGCCSCCRFPPMSDNLTTDNGPTDPVDAGKLLGNAWVSATISNESYTGVEGVFMSLQFFENGTFSATAVAIDPNGIGAWSKGHYHITGNTIKFTDIIEDDYINRSQARYTELKIADTTGIFNLDTTSDKNNDLLTIKTDSGLWGNAGLSLSRSKTG
ncbi:MAG TPA: hypothetical protein VK436_17120 [Methanocella sp.]|nr:hypothetical protein [Methanocella sp.]